MQLLNMRKDGSFFLNILSLQPLRDCSGLVRFTIGVMVEALPAFSKIKPLLMHADRFSALLPRLRGLAATTCFLSPPRHAFAST